MWPSHNKVFLLVVCFLMFSVVAHTATLDQIQKGTTTLSANSGSVTQAITSCDLSKSFLVFSMTVSSNRPGQFQIGGYMSASDEITFHRYDVSGTPEVTIEWQVFEFSSGVSVQRGTVTTLLSGGSNVSLSPTITTSSSFAMVNMRKDGGQYGSDDGITANITSSSNLYIDRESGGANPQHVHWQVVEWTGATVEKVVHTLSSGSDSTSYTLSSSVDMDKTMLVGNHRVSGNVNSDDLPASELYDDDTVIFTRTGTSRNMYFVCYVVEFSDNTDVVHGAIRMLISEDSVTTDICDVDADESGIILPSNFGRAGGNCQTTDDEVGHVWACFEMVDDNTIQATRSEIGYALRIPFQVLEFTASTPSGCSPPEPGASTPRTAPGGDGLCLATLPIELNHFSVDLINGFTANIKWSTLSETNNEWFHVERSNNLVDFVTVAQLEGAGTSLEPNDYMATDDLISAGTYYYRLRQTDTDGTTTVSETISITVGAEYSLTVYPNPTNHTLQVRYIPGNGSQRLYVTNMIGEVIYDEHITDPEMVSSSIPLSTGIYSVNLVQNEVLLGSAIAVVR
jgi:hypothetical protein